VAKISEIFAHVRNKNEERPAVTKIPEKEFNENGKKNIFHILLLSQTLKSIRKTYHHPLLKLFRRFNRHSYVCS
jgi:hypothetical protein